MRSSVRHGVGALAITALVTLVWPAQAFAGDCFAGLRGALEQGGYGPGVDCSDIVQTIRYVGRTKPHQGHSYFVYLLSYRTKTHGYGVPHYGQRILIFDAHRKYLGHYHLEDGHRLRIVGSDVLLNVPANQGNRLHLGRASPPDPEWLDGDTVGFAQ